MDVKRKRLRAEIKDDDKGTVDLVFATFNVKDHDGDVTLPGAFEDGAKVPVSQYNHNAYEGKMPVGVATLKSTAKEGRATAQYFMDDPAAHAAFMTIKRLHEAGVSPEWSYGYDPVKFDYGEWTDGSTVRFLHQQKVKEISPVIQGAGLGTRVLATKGVPEPDGSYHGAVKSHSTLVRKDAWNQAEVVASIDADASISDLHSIFAYHNPAADPTLKSSYLFPHHAQADGAAVVRGCVLSIARLNALGGQMPESARKGAYEHLAQHLKDAGLNPPAFRLVDAPAATLNDELMDALSGVSSAIDSALRVVALRAEKGKKVSHVNQELMEWLLDDMGRLRHLFSTPEEDAREQFVRWIASSHTR